MAEFRNRASGCRLNAFYSRSASVLPGILSPKDSIQASDEPLFLRRFNFFFFLPRTGLQRSLGYPSPTPIDCLAHLLHYHSVNYRLRAPNSLKISTFLWGLRVGNLKSASPSHNTPCRRPIPRGMSLTFNCDTKIASAEVHLHR